MDLTDLRRALERFWLLSLLTFLVTVALGFVLATSDGSTYESTATVAVSPNPAEGGSVQGAEFEIPTIVEILSSRDFRETVSDAVPEDAASENVSLDAAREVDTGIITITASGNDPQAVSDWANTAAEQIVDQFAPSDLDPDTPPTTRDLVVVEVVNTAVPDSGTGGRSTAPVMLAAVVLGLILAGAVAAFAYKWSVAFDLAAKIRDELGVPVVGEIPATRALRAPDADLRELLEDGSPALTEAFQALRTNMEVLIDEDSPTLAVTSWRRDEGTSTVTAALGIMMAAVGDEVVMIDTDLRTPTLHDRLQEPFGEGLAEFDELGTEVIVRETADPNLSLVPAGVPTRHPAQILAVALPEAIATIRADRPDAFILLDTPALGPVLDGGRRAPRIVAETATVLREAHNVLLVVRATTAQLPDLATSVQRLREQGVVVVGAVINRRPGRLWRG